MSSCSTDCLKQVLAQWVDEFVTTSLLTKQDLDEIVAFCLNINRQEIPLFYSTVMTKEDKQRCYQLLKKRALKHPLDYLFGLKLFYGIELLVTPDVLIPRHETEILVDKIVNRMRHHPPKVIVDICCGSGCIGLALKKAFPKARVYLVDISEKALELAKFNAQSLQLEVECLLGDLSDPVFSKNIIADLVVCNPPYISEDEYESLEPDVKEYEPKLALVSGETGLEVYQKLADQLPLITKNKTLVAFEIGASQQKSVKDFFEDSNWTSFSCEKDYAGHDRFIFLERESSHELNYI